MLYYSFIFVLTQIGSVVGGVCWGVRLFTYFLCMNSQATCIEILLLFFFFSVCGPLTVVASPVVEHRLRTRRLSGHGSRAQPLCGMWDLPGPGHEPVSPASAGGLSTTEPPGKPASSFHHHKSDMAQPPSCYRPTTNCNCGKQYDKKRF